MKKKLCFLLALIIFLAAMPFGEVKAEDKVYKYVLTKDPTGNQTEPTLVLQTDDAREVLGRIQAINDSYVVPGTIAYDYTLTLNDDLEIPLDKNGFLQVLKLSRDFTKLTIEGNNHTISAVDSDKEGAFFITLNGSYNTTGGLYFKNLTFDGAVDGVNKYNLIHASDSLINIDMYNCTLKNAVESALYSWNSQVTVKKSKIMNCGTKERNYFEVQGRSQVIEDSVFIGNRGSAYFFYCADLKIINSDFKNNESAVYSPLNFSEVQNLLVKGGSIVGNKGYTGAIYQNQVRSAVYEDLTIADNEGTSQGAIAITSYDFKIKNCTITGNKAEESSAIRVQNYSYGHVNGLIENSIISENIGDNYGAIFIEDNCDLKINNTVISDNVAKRNGGAVVVASIRENTNLTINGGKFINNYAGDYGGAIYTYDGIYEFLDLGDDPNYKPYKCLNIASDVVFEGNVAGQGYFNPPQNYKDFTHLKFTKFSLENKLVLPNSEGKWEHVRSLLNNYDIAYINKISTVVYDVNNGSNEVYVVPTETVLDNDNQIADFLPIKEYKEKIKTISETGLHNGDRIFESWNTKADGKGTKYLPEDLVNVKGNLYLYAQWYDDYVKLILDENYLHKKAKEKNVRKGDLIKENLYTPRREGYKFKGWSYKKTRLNKIKSEDRIYEQLTLYAIWEGEEEEEIKGEEHKAYIFGYPDKSVRPNGSITRAEAAAMLARLLNIESIGASTKPMFPDTTSAWYNKAINAIVQRGIMKGYPDGRFRPNSPITRAEFTQMISAIDNKPYGVAPFRDVLGHWAERAIGSEYQAKRITGYPDGLFRPDANITRAEAAVILNKIFERNFDNLSLLKCKNPQIIKRFIDLNESFWAFNDMVEATNTHEYLRRYNDNIMNRIEEDWLLIK